MIALDEETFTFLYSLTHKSSLLDGLFIFLASYLFWFVILWVFWVLVKEREWRNEHSLWRNRFQYFALGLIAVILSRGILANIINSLFNSPRPFVALNIDPLVGHPVISSLPSGHMAALVPVVLAAFLFNRRVGWWGLFLALVVGLSRVIAGLHWPSDIAAGMLVGAFSFFLVYLLFKKGKLI